MSRPDDIPQRVWDISAKMASEYVAWLNAGNSTGSLSPHAEAAMADTIARAILAAEQREREAIAMMVDGAVESVISVSPVVSRSKRNMGRRIAAAIRSRGDEA